MKYDIVISGYIGGWNASADYIRYKLSDFKNKRVDVCICSLGGYVDDGLQIYQMFKDHGDVHAHFCGMSASAATFLAMGCKTVDMAKNSLLLIHNGSMFIDTWGSYNKEQIDALVAQLGKTRDDLQTIDEVIASIYADRCKKPVKDVLEKMKSAAWINSADALSFGLVDKIADDAIEDKAQNAYINSVTPDNSTLKQLGLPLIPETHPDDTGILQKVARLFGVDKQNRNTNTATEQPQMIKLFTVVAALLSVDFFKANKDGNVELTQEQMKLIDDTLREKDAEISRLKADIAQSVEKPGETPAANSELASLREELEKCKADLASAQAQVENLKNAPAETQEVEGKTNEVSAFDLYKVTKL